MHSDLPSLYHPPSNTRNAVNSNSLAFSLVRVNTTRFSRSIISSVTIGYGMIYPATSLNLWKFRITQWILIISRWTDLGCMRPGPYANCYILFVSIVITLSSVCGSSSLFFLLYSLFWTLPYIPFPFLTRLLFSLLGPVGLWHFAFPIRIDSGL